MEDRAIVSVSEINLYLQQKFDADVLLQNVIIRGEISNHRAYPSGHHYFSLKDEGGVLKAVMFKGSAQKLRFKPENGMMVLARGRISVYPRDGQYQLYASSLTPEGAGALHIAFEQLKKKLGAMGYFDSERKKPLPLYPGRIALVTSPAGAAVRDMLRILKRRFPLSQVFIVPVRVQGDEAPDEIAEGIRFACRHRLADVIITGRG
ncbi:exodeoxyribonuclease VII large subunit, partial [Oscillospiraceae bacterium OttesenSCG-928-F05]|nr:exodeoxyribonuclease VII large subunit [Oscillospiraceae bacterium OttesenSCG-928-F05]